MYYTLLPNYYNGLNLSTPFPYGQTQPKKPSILQLLSQALKRSIYQYEASYTLEQPKVTEQSPKQAEKQEQKKGLIVEDLVQEEKIENNNIVQIKEKEQHQQKLISQVNQQKNNKISIQSTSNDEISSQNLLSQLNKAKLKVSLPKTLLKQHTRSKKPVFNVVVPEVDLIQTAYLPSFNVDEQEIRRKRNSLLERRIECWDHTAKGRGNRREIKMLNR